MNSYQIIFKSGTSTVVYTTYNYDNDMTSFGEEFELNRGEIVAVIDLTANLKNETAYILEKKGLINQLSINKEKVGVDTQERQVDRGVELRVREQNKLMQLTQPSPLTRQDIQG